ncbi:hypothetical protein RRG08_050689 [Elysia crispata]|uniref:Uncharacterized protein n=1 Tax=Elysia crispata TaxID=231223 RepID=A0AAE1A4D4_9GAST|nr:hypothetical protein RRG08_050689 [Elysia crispata]
MAYRKRDNRRAAVKFIEWKRQKYNILLFTKSYSPEGQMCHQILHECSGVTRENYDCVCYEKRGDVTEMESYLWALSGTNNRESAHVFIRGDYLGGYRTLLKLKRSGKLQRIINNLVNFPPGARNYVSTNKSWNLALEADPDVLPDLVLKVAAHSMYTSTSVKIVQFSPDDLHNVDCEILGERAEDISLPDIHKPASLENTIDQVPSCTWSEATSISVTSPFARAHRPGSKDISSQRGDDRFGIMKMKGRAHAMMDRIKEPGAAPTGGKVLIKPGVKQSGQTLATSPANKGEVEASNEQH